MRAVTFAIDDAQLATMSRHKQELYDQDDLYDYDDGEEDFYGDYAEYDPGEQQLAAKKRAKVSPPTQTTVRTACNSCTNALCAQVPAKPAAKSKPSSASKTSATSTQPAATAGASALAQSLFKRQTQKGGELCKPDAAARPCILLQPAL